MDLALTANPSIEDSAAETPTIVALHSALSNLMDVQQVVVPVAPDEVVQFRGQLALPSAQAYTLIRDRFRDIGYIAFLRRSGSLDGVQAVKGVLQLGRNRVWINLVLFFATLATMLISATVYQVLRRLAESGFNPDRGDTLRTALDLIGQQPAWLIEGIPFAATLLLILAVHEMGHYVAARIHRADVTLPYFIPFPPLAGLSLGTLGAFVRLRTPIEDRRALFDIGVAGPLAGLAIAAPLFVVGVALSRLHPTAPGASASGLGLSPLVTWIVGWLQPQTFELNLRLELHPIAIAAWFGLLLTVLNLLPIGSLDGGHVTYALFGRAATTVSILTFTGLLLLSVFAWRGWVLWAFVSILFGLRHPPPLNDVTPLDAKRRLLAFATFAIGLILFVPTPFA
ncbi:MAG TPA: site-2 protease family protein [Anaerolineae bacterium]|nr:site-2 protease family protein [Anaerolineae bacterium]